MDVCTEFLPILQNFVPCRGHCPKKLIRFKKQFSDINISFLPRNFQLFSPLSSFSSLIPSNLAIGIKIFLTSNERFFITSTAGVKPRYVISDARMYFQVCILKEPVYQKIHAKLNSGSELQINFLSKFIKVYIECNKIHDHVHATLHTRVCCSVSIGLNWS